MELLGIKFGDWQVIAGPKEYPGYEKKWKCRCLCGAEHWVWQMHLNAGRSRRCVACAASLVHVKHGESKTPLYNSWLKFRQRCNGTCPDGWRYVRISYLPGWDDYKVFAKWARANGYKEGLVMHRKDNTEGYNPDNCQFLTQSEHMRTHHAQGDI